MWYFVKTGLCTLAVYMYILQYRKEIEVGAILMGETLKLILNELKELKEDQQKLRKDVRSIKGNFINGLEPYFESIEKFIDEKTEEIKTKR